MMLGGNFTLAGRPVFFIFVLFESFCVFLFFPSPFLTFDICYRIENKIYINYMRVCIKYTQYTRNTRARAFITLVNSTNLVYPLNRFLTLCTVSVLQFMDQAPTLKDIRAS